MALLRRLSIMRRPAFAAWHRHAAAAHRRTLFGASSDPAKEIRREADAIYDDVLEPLGKGLLADVGGKGRRAVSGERVRTPYPLVFLLGNHSSGKSTFINYLLGRDVQQTGVAPTDDSFTVIAPGRDDDYDQDGPSLIGNPDFGFEGLRAFGPALMHHVNLKVRKNLNPAHPELADPGIIVVDSPGMIDNPVSTHQLARGATRERERAAARAAPAVSIRDGGYGALSAGGDDRTRDRGYDFEGVTRWMAARADVILLFFDPDKPGTTGETLSCLTHSLAGMDYKLHIILNKVDQFDNIHDFARAYGSLCWNLSKVIPRKDLPRIYTMCVPTEHHQGPSRGLWDQGGAAGEFLTSSRDDVIGEVRRAPHRRLDNTVTKLYDAARLLHMHASVAELVRADLSGLAWRWAGAAAGLALAGGGAAFFAFAAGLVPYAAGVGALSLAGAGGTFYLGQRARAKAFAHACTDEGLTAAFRRCHVRELAEDDEFVLALWARVRPQLRVALVTAGAKGLPKVSGGDLARLERVRSEDVPRLRRLVGVLPEPPALDAEGNGADEAAGEGGGEGGWGFFGGGKKSGD